MSLRCLRTLLAFSFLSLTACAQQSSLHEIQHEIKTLNQDMVDLSQQAVILSEQNALNAESTQGLYLLPDAGAPALLESQIGMLKISLSHITATTNGTQVTLLIQEKTQQPLPAFSGMIAWKIRTDKTDEPSTNVNGQQSFTAPAQLASPGEATLTLVLPDVAPENLRWIRIHDIHSAAEGITAAP
ncbi:DUF3251 domain-containing protein [Klebsiella sp. BIGb0407]|uniref:DUF3251 domain-containing protein n=1 Tax=Klebsiella sp. BIGb0407 TaxID=2940603 RepID=UPI0021670BD4|nr:DUF3251 domain-containing protein [Klebsiella sp. BIGb0407]MCS3432349.1 hypothetical protein [Klebsiella sp. BIGb0407]